MPTGINVHKLPGFNTVWHKDTSLVFESRNELFVIGKLTDNNILSLSEDDVKICDKYKFKYKLDAQLPLYQTEEISNKEEVGSHIHTSLNDDQYDPDIEYEFVLYSADGFIDCEKYRTLEELFSFEHDKWELNTCDLNEIKRDVREKLNSNFIWRARAADDDYKIEVRQVDTRKEHSSDPSSCTCRPGFRGDDAFCKFHKN